VKERFPSHKFRTMDICTIEFLFAKMRHRGRK